MPVKDTKLNGAALIPELGADFTGHHMAADDDAAKKLSGSDARLARTFKNSVVLATEQQVKDAMAAAEYTATPLVVAGINWVKVTTTTKDKSFKAKDVESQQVVPGVGPLKVKYRLAADDAKKTSSSPTPSPGAGPIVVATGVEG